MSEDTREIKGKILQFPRKRIKPEPMAENRKFMEDHYRKIEEAIREANEATEKFRKSYALIEQTIQINDEKFDKLTELEEKLDGLELKRNSSKAEIIFNLFIFVCFILGSPIFKVLGIICGVLAVKSVRKSREYTKEIKSVQEAINNLYKEEEIEVTKHEEVALIKENSDQLNKENTIPESNIKIEETVKTGPRLVLIRDNSNSLRRN